MSISSNADFFLVSPILIGAGARMKKIVLPTVFFYFVRTFFKTKIPKNKK